MAVSMKRMCKGQVPLFFVLQKRWFKKKKERRSSRLDCSVTYVSHLTWCKAQLWLNRVSIDPSELYHIMQSCCLLHSARVRAHLLSVTGCFASAASFGFCLHASMHSHCLDNGTDSLWTCAQQPQRVYIKPTVYELQCVEDEVPQWGNLWTQGHLG